MKVVYFAPTSTLYGDNIALLNILQVLALKNVCFLIITSREGEFTRKLRELGYEYALCNFNPVWWPTISSFRDIVLFLPRLVYYKLFGYLLVDRRRIRKIVSEFNPDIIHSNNSCFTLGLEIANDLNIPHIQHIREYGKLDIGKSYFPTKNNYVQSISKKNDLVLCITNDIKR